ncbi:MAG: CBS domain-containing protein [Saccharothrix sp.]|nr:CBS domain-containing protein [Saccharothrix sp.]
MKAEDLMTARVITVHPDRAAKEAARLLAEHTFSTLPVVDDDGRLVGVVTEADLLRHRVLPDPGTYVHGLAPLPPAATVGEVMSTGVVKAGPGTHVVELSKVMLDRHVHTVPVVDGDRLVGVVSRRDLLRAIARDDDLIAKDVRRHLALVGHTPWHVAVTDGVVTLTGDGADETERHVATVVAGAVAGATRVEVRTGATT